MGKQEKGRQDTGPEGMVIEGEHARRSVSEGHDREIPGGRICGGDAAHGAGQVGTEAAAMGREMAGGVRVSGSYAKGTAIRGESLAPSDVDVDLFLSMSPEMREPLAEMQRTLCGELREYDARIANVSVRIGFENRRVDLVVGRRREDGEDHTLWRAREGTWVRTNVVEQVRFVRESGCLDEILALKIWRRRQGLYFPSYCLELAVIEALAGGTGGAGLAARVLRVLGWLATELPAAELRDPANRSNVVSEVMTESERWRVAHAAGVAGQAAEWREVI